jgi:hypothetical protein
MQDFNGRAVRRKSTDVSQEHVLIFRVKAGGKQSMLYLFFDLKMEETCSSEIRLTFNGLYNGIPLPPKNITLHNHRFKNLKSYVVSRVSW